MGALLLARDTRGTHLTAAGRAFLPGAHEALRTARAAVDAARAVDQPLRIVVGHAGAPFVTAAVRALREAVPDADVHTLHLDWHGPRDALLEHRVDVAVAGLPFPTGGLEVHPLYEEQRVLLVPRGHRLAERTSVRLADFADEPLARLVDTDPDYAAFWRVEPRPDGGPAPAGPVTETPEDRLEAVAGGQAVALATAALGGALRPDLVAIPVRDLDPVPVVLAHRSGDHRRLVLEFERCARTQLAASGTASGH